MEEEFQRVLLLHRSGGNTLWHQKLEQSACGGDVVTTILTHLTLHRGEPLLQEAPKSYPYFGTPPNH